MRTLPLLSLSRLTKQGLNKRPKVALRLMELRTSDEVVLDPVFVVS